MSEVFCSSRYHFASKPAGIGSGFISPEDIRINCQALEEVNTNRARSGLQKRHTESARNPVEGENSLLRGNGVESGI